METIESKAGRPDLCYAVGFPFHDNYSHRRRTGDRKSYSYTHICLYTYCDVLSGFGLDASDPHADTTNERWHNISHSSFSGFFFWNPDNHKFPTCICVSAEYRPNVLRPFLLTPSLGLTRKIDTSVPPIHNSRSSGDDQPRAPEHWYLVWVTYSVVFLCQFVFFFFLHGPSASVT